MPTILSHPKFMFPNSSSNHLIFQHSHNINNSNSFPLPTIICYFILCPGGTWIKAQSSLETYKPHGQYLKNNSLMTDHPIPHGTQVICYRWLRRSQCSIMIIEIARNTRHRTVFIYFFWYFLFPPDNKYRCLDTLPTVALESYGSHYDSESWPKFRVPKQDLREL